MFPLLVIGMVSGAFAQNKMPAMDKSPMDISYYPVNYPILKIQNKVTEPIVARVMYSRPQRNGRTIFGELVEYGKVWRMGANEATEIEFFKDVTMGGKSIPKGRYTIYAIPEPDKWTVIVNKETDTWGSFKYDSKNDLVRMEAPVQKLADPADDFSLSFEKSTGGFNMQVAWDTVMVNLPLKVNEKAAQAKPPVKSTKKKIP